MAPSKPKATKAGKKPTPKPAAKSVKPAIKAAPKAAAKPAKPAVKAKVSAKPAPTHAAAAARAASIHLVPATSRVNAPTPKWMDEAIRYAQQNPAVSLVSLIAAAMGLLLLLS